MKNALLPVAALLLGVAILLTGSGLQGTLLPVRASIEQFSTISIGFIGGAYFFGFTLGCLKGGKLVGIVGHVRVFAAMTALASAAPLLHSLVIEPFAWGILRFVSGFCFAVLYVVIESWLNEQSSNESRGLVFSTYVMITLTVIGAGQMLLVLYDPRDMHLFAIASVLVSLAAIPVVLSQAPQPEHPVTVSVDIRRVYHISRSGTVGCLASGLANGTFWALAPLFVAAYSDNLNLAAIFMTAGVAGGAIAQWPMGYLSDRIGRRRTLVVAGMIGVAMSTFVMLQSAAITPIVLVFIGVVWGAASFPLYAIAVAQANDYADASDYVMLSSGLLLMYGAGAIVGPFVASAVMTILPGRGMFLFTGVTHVLLVIYTVNRIMRRGRAPAEHHMAFSDALATAHTASQVYEEEFQHHVEKDDNK